MWNRALIFFGYLYLIRVPVLALLIVLGMWYGFLSGSSGEPILRGIYDVAPVTPSQPLGENLMERLIYVTLAALLAATAMMVTATLIIRNADDRFKIGPVHFSPGLKFLLRFIPLVAVCLTVGAALKFAGSGQNLPRIILGLAIGAGIWFLLTVTLQRWVWSNAALVLSFTNPNLIPGDKSGYVNQTGDRIRPRHLFAAIQFGIALLFYIAIWIISISAPHEIIPTLALILLLLMLSCFGLAGVTFYLDRYRIPVLLVFFAMAWIPGMFRQSDHFYRAVPSLNDPPQNLGSELISPRPVGQVPVLVAATGGGIQAAAWTARVLIGLSSAPFIPNFEGSIRLISSVSGGSVGSMFFVAAYDHSSIPAVEKGSYVGGLRVSGSTVIKAADAPSLDAVAWGLTYPDLVFNLAPWAKGVGFNGSHTWHFVDGGAIFADRGRTLENSWYYRLPEMQKDSTLAGWRADVSRGERPAVIFNSTLVETGQRYILGTTTFDAMPPGSKQNLDDRLAGRLSFERAYPRRDIAVRTAVRLSASFPYVSPAARVLDNTGGQNIPDIYTPEFHAVDGGYYDNYGMATLLDWLDAAINAAGPAKVPKKIAIVEIRSSPGDTSPDPSGGGFSFQSLAPFSTLLHVRSAGQLSHNALDKDLIARLSARDDVKVCSFVFEFKNVDSRGCRRAEPLNWHLTPEDIEALDKALESATIETSSKALASFLNGGDCSK